MQVGDLVWALDLDKYGMGRVINRRLAIIRKIDNFRDSHNPYHIMLIACGREGRTSEKYLAPMDSNKSVKK